MPRSNKQVGRLVSQFQNEKPVPDCKRWTGPALLFRACLPHWDQGGIPTSWALADANASLRPEPLALNSSKSAEVGHLLESRHFTGGTYRTEHVFYFGFWDLFLSFLRMPLFVLFFFFNFQVFQLRCRQTLLFFFIFGRQTHYSSVLVLFLFIYLGLSLLRVLPFHLFSFSGGSGFPRCRGLSFAIAVFSKYHPSVN